MKEKKHTLSLHSTLASYHICDNITVLFADVKDFSKHAEQLPLDVLASELHHLYSYLDKLTLRYNLRKIKTIGDGYMLAGGLNKTNPLRDTISSVLMGLEVQTAFHILRKRYPHAWALRIGIHTGQVIVGYLGQTDRLLDVWGETVNTASRMETFGKVDEVNITKAVYEIIHPFFECKHKGTIQALQQTSYHVLGLKLPYRINTHNPYRPNPLFFEELDKAFGVEK